MSVAALPVPMSTPQAMLPPPVPPPVAPTVRPQPFRWTVDLLQQVTDAGFLEGRSVFLINGELLEMPNPGPDHDMALSLADYKLKAVFGAGHVVRIQCGVVFGLGTAPAPDVAVVVGSPRDYKKTPRTAVLIVEVADSSLSYDRGEKANLYAAAGVADYWVLDVVNGRLEVFRDPRPDPAAPFGAKYAATATYAPGDSVAPLALPAVPVAVADLLP
jgi:Uma2 family endonuclease